MKRPNGKIAASAAFLMGWVLVVAPATAMAGDSEQMTPMELEPPLQVDDDVEEAGKIAGAPAARGTGGLGSRTFLTLSGGVRGGLGGVAGYGFDNHGTITDDQGQTRQFPKSDHDPWVYPEYYGHFGLGPVGGLYAEARLNEVFGLEVGINHMQNNASGHVDKNLAGSDTTISRIESDQSTSAISIPVLAKGVIPSESARPFLAAGVEIVSQTSSDLEYEEDQQAGQYGGDGAMEQLNERNQIETSTYALLAATLGVEIVASPFIIPIELRVGYALGHDRNDMDSRAWYDSEEDQIHYDGVFMSHFAIFTGLMYEFEFIP